jgi:hypothetical protein
LLPPQMLIDIARILDPWINLSRLYSDAGLKT